MPIPKQIFLESLNIQGFKSIENLDTHLNAGLNILIGKNGAGKSNFLEAIYHIMQVNTKRQVPFRSAQVELKSSDGHTFSVMFKRNLLRHQMVQESVEDNPLIEERLAIDGKEVYSNTSKDENATFITVNERKINIKGYNLWHIFRILGYQRLKLLYIKFNIPKNLSCIDNPGTLRIPIAQEETWETPLSSPLIDSIFFYLEFEYDLSQKRINKANLLKDLKIPEKVTQNLKLYSPISDVRFNENINIYNDDKVTIVENIKIDFKINKNWLPWSQLSDGTKRLFYIISEISNLDNGIILIEEPELGIHPHQFNQVMDFLKLQADNNQIIISTHSPKALDHLKEDELGNIMVASYNNKKGTQINALTSSQKKKAKKYMKEVGFLSDYWMLSNLE